MSQRKSFKSTPFNVFRYGRLDERPIEPSASISSTFGNDFEMEINKALEKRVNEAIEARLSQKGANRTQDNLHKRRNVFGIKLGNQPPAEIHLYKILQNSAERRCRNDQI